MANYNDSFKASLAAKGYTSSFTDAWNQYLQDNTAIASTVTPDMLAAWLSGKGFTGSVPDMLQQYAGSRGYTSHAEQVIADAFLGCYRDVYNFDGVDDKAQLAYRAINPDGDNYLEFRSPLNINCTIIAQNISSTASSREFQLWQGASGELNLTFGGSNAVIASSADGYELGGIYYLSLVGTTATLAKGLPTNVIKVSTFVRGAAREPTAVTLIGCRGSGAGVFGTFAQGPQYDVRINGTLWPISEKDSAIQLPVPSGLGEELITTSVLENPAVKGSQWSYLGAGRWQYVGDGSFNELRFIAGASHPLAGFLEFEIESITGTLSCVSGSTAIPRASFSTTGKKRYFYTDVNEGSALGAAVSFKRPSNGVVTSCIIKSISFKPLVGYSANKANGGDFSDPALWTSNSANVVVSGGSLNFTNAGIGNRVAQDADIIDDKTYEITYTIGSLTSGSVRCRLIGTSTMYESTARTSAGTYTETITVTGPYATTPIKRILFEARSAGTNATLVDDLAVREVTTCNPLTLVNTTAERWSEIEVPCA